MSFYRAFIFFDVNKLNDQQDLGSNLHMVRIENPSKILFGQININLIRHKFDLLMNIIKNEIRIFMISETKIDNSFSISQFTMTGYSIPFRLDRPSNGNGILLLVSEDILCRTVKTDCDGDFSGDKFKKEKMVTLLFLQST